MTSFRAASAVALALWLSPGGAAALTAEEAWDDLRALFEGVGADLEAGEPRREGAVLIVPAVAIGQAAPGGGVETEIGDIRFTEEAGGSVAIAFPESYVVTFRGTTDDASPVPTEMDLTIEQPGLSLIASGEGTERRYAVAAPSFTFTGSNFREGGEAIDASLTGSLTDVSGIYTVTGEDAREVTSDLAAAALAVSVDAPIEDGGRSTFGLTLEDIVSEGTATLATQDAPGDLSAAIEAGFAGTSRVGYGASTLSVRGEEEAGTFAFDASSGSGSLDAALGPDGLAYTSQASEVAMEVGGTQIPIPGVSATAADTEIALTLPLLPGDTPGAFAGTVRFIDLALSEAVWSLFDPAAVLPRDPATLILDVVGGLRLDRPLFDVEPEGPATTPPGSVETLTIRELRLAAAGAALEGTGDLTFDETNTQTFGVAQPVGQLDLRATGLEGLIDRLVTLGVIPPDQLLGARMMIGAFAQKTEGEDTFTSTIEFTPDGQVLANGARIR